MHLRFRTSRKRVRIFLMRAPPRRRRLTGVPGAAGSIYGMNEPPKDALKNIPLARPQLTTTLMVVVAEALPAVADTVMV